MAIAAPPVLRRLLVFYLLLGLPALLICAPAGSVAPGNPFQPDPDRIFLMQLDSRAMGRTLPYIVKLPRASYKRRLYPVVYLLHGWQGDENQMLKVNSGLATRHQMVLVQPTMEGEGGWFDSPRDPRRQYVTMLLDEIVPAAEDRFPVRRDRLHRAITGFSMGGQGALRAAIRRPDLFAVVGATSGIMDLTRHQGAYGMKDMLGPPERLDIYRSYSVVYGLAHLIPGIQRRMAFRIFLECPDGDIALMDNLLLAQRLRRLGVRFHGDLDHPGVHSRQYYGTRIDGHLAWIRAQFEDLTRKVVATSVR